MNNKFCVLMVVAVSLILFCPQSARAKHIPPSRSRLCARGAGHQFGSGVEIDCRDRPEVYRPIDVCDQQAGATGSTAAADLITSKPDGYKLLSNNHPYFATTIHTQKLPFDPHDIAPLANFVSARQGMLVRTDSPFRTFKDLLNYDGRIPGS